MAALIVLDRDGEFRQDAIVDDFALALYLRRYVIAVRLGRFRRAELLQRRQRVEVTEPFVRFRRLRGARGDHAHRRATGGTTTGPGTCRRWAQTNAMVYEEIFPVRCGQLGQIVEIRCRGHFVARWIDVKLAQFRCDN